MRVRKCVTCDGVCVRVCVTMRHHKYEPATQTILKASFALCTQKMFWSHPPEHCPSKRLLNFKTRTKRSPSEPPGNRYRTMLLTSIASPNKTHQPNYTKTYHHSHNHNTLAPSILTRSYYFPSQISHFVSRFLSSKMNGSECSRSVHLCFRPCLTRWSSGIRYTLHRYTRSTLHWRACFLTTQSHTQPTRGPLSSCTKLPGDTTRLFALVAHVYCQWLVHNNFLSVSSHCYIKGRFHETHDFRRTLFTLLNAILIACCAT